MNREPSEPDALDHRIDASLRRRFTPPTSLDTLVTRSHARRRRPLELWLLACAAVLVAALGLWWFTRPEVRRFERLRPDRVALDGSGFDAPAFCQLVGPLEDARDPALPQAPDLVALYRAMDACQRSTAAVACEANDELLARLQASYGPRHRAALRGRRPAARPLRLRRVADRHDPDRHERGPHDRARGRARRDPRLLRAHASGRELRPQRLHLERRRPRPDRDQPARRATLPAAVRVALSPLSSSAARAPCRPGPEAPGRRRVVRARGRGGA